MNRPILSIFLAAVCVSFLLGSCSKTINCDDGTIAILPVGFARTDFDSAMVVRYKQDNAFDIAVDSTRMTYYSNGDHDTGKLSIMASNSVSGVHPSFLIPGYDYKIFLSAAGRTFAITNIVQQGNKTQSYSTGLFNNKKLVTCTNSILSCKVDGNPVSAPDGLQGMPVNIVK